MSEADPADVRLVATRDGVRVEKTFEPEDFPVPAIAFSITSERDEPVEVRITDGVPDPVDPQDIGFHPKYGAEFWSVDGDHIVFERGFDPGEEYTTVYGLRSETDGVEQYLSEPTIDDVDPPLPDEEDITLDLADPNGSGDGSEAADEDASAAAEDDETTDGGADAEGPAGPSLPDGVVAGEDAADGNGTGAGVAAGDLAETLAAELRTGEVSDEAVETLRAELDVEAKGSVEARVERIQADVSDLRAYRDALEEFLDENGDAQQLLADLEGRIEEVSEHVATLRADADRRAERIDDLDDRLAETDDRLEAADDDLAALSDDVERLESTVADVDEELSDLRDVEAELEEVRDDIEALAEMRERLSSVFGAGAGGGDGGDDDDDEE